MNIVPSADMVTSKGSLSDWSASALLLGSSTCTPTVNKGAVIMNIMRRTNITSTNGVTLISLKGFDFKFLYTSTKLLTLVCCA